jgi:hypothetical protein
MVVALIFGVILLVAAGIFGWLGWKAKKRGGAIEATETTPCGQVPARVSAMAGDTAVVQLTECIGVARPGPSGPLTAPYSSQPCVWYRNHISHHYWDTEWQTDSKGNRTSRRVRRQSTVSSTDSDSPFAVADSSGEVAVAPQNARMDKPYKTYDQFEQRPRESFMNEFFLGDRTIGYQYEEWILSPDQPLYVLGGAVARGGEAMLAKPDKGELLVSTRSQEELQAATRRATMGWMAGAIASGVVGVVLLVVAASLA